MVDKKTTSYPKEKINILFLENISDAAVEHFKESGYASVRKLSGALSEEQLVNEVKDVHLLGIRSKTQITPKVLDAAKKLQAIGCFCIGVNQVDLKSATNHGVVVFNAPYSNTRSVAELVIGLAIMLIRRIPDKSKAAHDGIWLKEAKGSYEMRGKTLGIIGYGNIGSQVSVLAEALGMKVIFYDTVTKLPLGNAVAKKTIKEVVSQADIVTLHVPDTLQTKNLINKTVLKQFKKGSILLNYARGEVVDTGNACEMSSGRAAVGRGHRRVPLGAGEERRSLHHPLQGLPNVILTPHIGGSTEEAQENIGEDVSNKLFQYLETGMTIGSHTIPSLSLPHQEGTHRILHIHKNVPGVLSEINSTLSKHNINILGQYLKTNDEIGYVVLDIDKKLSNQALQLLKEVKQTIKTRLLY
ncbi:phosphoglycerate dehydrogenase [Puia sp. P3]|uniref:phosphoglycerate dehydrogenase n=1 Tax=Puia sp. P3 TaxID=3423952 RepID=UPI003D669569